MKKHFLFVKRSLAVAVASVMLLAAQNANAYTYTAIDGTGGTGNEGYAALVDGNIQSKSGMGFVNGQTTYYVIFKADKAIVPTNYFLITGNDTGSNPGRNWSSWKIYGANFQSDLDATRDASGWTLVDEKNNEILPAANFAQVELVCSVENTTAYEYFMVEVTEAVEGDVYLQMSEFGWGTLADFFETGALSYTVIDGDRNNADGEGLSKMFDGNYGTKWGNSQDADRNNFAIFKASREIAPTWYCLVTGTDNASWNHRNWRDWKIYGLKANDDSEATRDAEGWVLLDERNNVSEEVLPDKNSFEVFFEFNQGVTEKFQYFKIEISAIMSGTGYMQMSEFFLGNDATLKDECKKHYDLAKMTIDKPCQKSVADAYNQALDGIMTATNVFEMNELYTQALAMQTEVKNSINAYSDYQQIVNQLRSKFDKGTIAAEGQTIVGNYLNTNAAPDGTYPNGTYQYIMENLLLDVDGINAESTFANGLMEQYATDLTDGAIDVTYEVIGGDPGFNDQESCFSLFDGNDYTKWCTPGADHHYIVFKTSEPICPTYYRLFTSNDTGSNPERNWRTWTIYGANFTTDADWEDMIGWEGWVALDRKENVGSDLIAAASNTASFLFMSDPSDTPYQYFYIDITQPTGTIQMSEFSFGNSANIVLTRREYVEQFGGVDFSDMTCYAGYVEQYNAALAKLKTTASMVELGRLYTELTNLTADIEASVTYYDDYALAVTDLETYLGVMSGEMGDLWSSYIYDESEPGATFAYGSYPYIMANHNLDNATIQQETTKINEVIKAALEGGFIVLGGNTAWNDNENHTKLVDKDMTTKWGGAMPADGSYVIFRTMEPTQPLFYKLTTGNDTEASYNRNWKDWQIYAANFASDAEATRDAEGWVLIEDRKDIGQDRLPAANFFTVPFGFSEGVEEEYQYFKVEVIAAYSGSDIQMTELEFGTEDEFEEMKQQYIDSLSTFNLDVVAEEELFFLYEDYEGAIYDAENMEDLYQNFNAIVALVDQFKISAAAYELFSSKVGENVVLAGKLEASDELSTLKAYLEGESAAGEQFTNGSAPVILKDHVLSADSLYTEMDYMNSLVAAAVAKGYVAGVEITSLVVNPSFAKGNEGWEGDMYAYNTNEEHTMAAAEFKDETSEFDIHQTLTGLKNGLYEVHISGATRPGDDAYSTNYTAMLYANGNNVYLKADMDDMIAVEDAVDRVNCWLNGGIADKAIYSNADEENGDLLGYVLWGVQSCCYAFLANRYDNVIVAEVTDGTLTFGVKNDGAQAGNSWTGLGNTRIIYLGTVDSEAAAAGLDRAIYGEQVIANSLNDYYGFSDLADYAKLPYVNEADLKSIKSNLSAAAAGDNAAKYDAIVKNSALFTSIYQAKFAYVDAMKTLFAVQDKWDAHEGVMGEGLSAYWDAKNTVIDGCMGIFTADEAAAAVAELVKNYPAYLDFDANKSKGSLDFTEVAPFEYEVKANGNRPNIGLNKCMYNALTADQCIVTFEYKSDAKLEGGALFFAHPTLTATETVAYGTLEAASEWTRVFIDITPALRDWNWGVATDNWMRWDLAASGSFTANVRNMIIISKAEMDAMGGQTINDGIADVIIDNEDAPAIYTLQGVRVAQPTEKGIYIVGGKKVLVR